MLFSKNLGLVNTNEELASLQKQWPNYDPAYICQAASIARRQAKAWMENLWKQYEPYADRCFLEHFEQQFTPRSWELYLGATLLKHGFKLGQRQDAGPDFDVWDKSGERRLAWIEAIAVRKGKGDDRVPGMMAGVATSVPEEKMLLRLANALDEKYKKYHRDLKNGIVKGHEPYVIAINRSSLDHVDPGLPLILKVLFGIGHLTLRIPI